MSLRFASPGRTRGLLRGGVALVAVFLGLASSSPPAHARVSDRDVAQSLRIGYEFWGSITDRVSLPQFHCEKGNVKVAWFPDLGSAMATARVLGCADLQPTINLEENTIRGLDDAHACAVITHEFGHLLGYTHNRTKGSIMYSSSTGTTLGLPVPAKATWDRAYRGAHCGGL